MLNRTDYVDLLKSKKMTLEEIPESERNEDIYIAAVEIDGYDLKKIPEPLRTRRICLAAVQETGFTILDVPLKHRDHQMYLAAVTSTPRAFQLVPDKERTPDIYLARIENDPGSLLEFPIEMQNEKNYLAAVQINGLALEHIPADKCTPAIYTAAIQQTTNALKFVPENEQTHDLFMSLVSKSGKGINQIPIEKRSIEICVAATRQNPLALRYVPEEIKSAVIDEVTPEALIAKNYLSVKYFPKNPDYTQAINSFLANIEYIIINNEDDDHELKDIQFMYANHAKRKGKSILVNAARTSDINDLMSHLAKINEVNAKDLHLVLVGHGSEAALRLAGMTKNNIADACNDCPQIKYIHMLGCNVAKAKPSDQEIQIINEFSLRMSDKLKLNFGMQTAINLTSNDANFQLKCIDFCKKNNLNGVYIVSKNDDGSYRLFSMKINSDGSLKEKSKIIPINNISNLNKILSKPLSFPQKNEEIFIIRDKKPLSGKELNTLRAAAYEYERFHPLHPKYKEDKTRYPFLANMKVSQENLLPSFFEKTVSTLESDPDINRDIQVKGVTKSLHVDLQRKNFAVSRSYLYTSEYKANRFFANRDKPNINYKKLNEERQKNIETMEKFSNDQTMAKSITTTVKKKRP